MLHLTRTLASVLLLAVPVLSGATPAKPIAEKRGPADDIPRVLTQIQSAMDKGLPSMDDSYHVPSVKTQYDLVLPKTFVADITARTNATWGLARITQAEKLQEQNPW
jgi:hypothetical protein